uniref:Protein kinase domain-containing protein n=1 Tax=Panagrellus redivivus TaxID=6233 RepID=A0A7E5A2A3_PANRE
MKQLFFLVVYRTSTSMDMLPFAPTQPPLAWSTMPPFDWRIFETKTHLHREILDRMRYGQSETFRDVCHETRRLLERLNTPEWRASERRKERELRWEDEFRDMIHLNEQHEPGMCLIIYAKLANFNKAISEAHPLALPVHQPQQQHQLQAPQQPAPQPQQLQQPEVERQATPPPPDFEDPATPPPPEGRQSAALAPPATHQSATPPPPEARQSATPPPPEPRRSATPQQADPEPQATTSAASSRKRRHPASPAPPSRRSGSARSATDASSNASDASAANTDDPQQPSAPGRRRQPKPKPVVPADTADIEGRDLPDAPPTIVKQKYVLVGQRLAAADQEQVIRRETFKAVRYGIGIVVAQGELEGVNLPAQEHPERNWGIVYNDPEDPITSMAAGDAFLVMLSLKGHIFTVGRNAEGQLGAGRRPGVHRQRLTPNAMRRTVIRKKKTSNGKTKVEHVIFEALRCDANVATAIDKIMYHWGDVFGPVMRSSGWFDGL